MKSLEKQPKSPRKHNSWKTYAIAAATALSVTLGSCSTPTGTDIVKDKQKVEVAENQLSLLIQQRKELVETYNQYIALSSSPSYRDNLDFQKAKAQTFDQIMKLEKNINKQIKKVDNLKEDLREDELKALEANPNPNQPMDPSKYDFIR